jgi:outer membrane protein TolC
MRPSLLLPATVAAWATACAPVAPGPTIAAQEPAAVSPRSPDPSALDLGALLDTLASRSPRLRAARAAAAAAASRVSGASTLPDPVVQLGVMNLGLPDLAADMPASMAPSVQVMQAVPFPGKLGLRGEMAGASREMAEAGAEEAWWEIRDEASARFYEIWSLDRRLEVMGETLGLLGDFQTVAQARYASGEGRQADVLRADVEVARIRAEIRRMETLRRAAAARLNGLLDRPGSTPVPSPQLGPPPAAIPGIDTLRTWARESRPALRRTRLALSRAETRVSLARREIWPDLTVGVSYGRRDAGVEIQHMASAMVGFSVPIHAGSRQLAVREEAEAMVRMSDADLAELQARVDARVAELVAELDRARSLVELYRTEVLPQARANVESALSSYRVGEVDFATLVDAQLAVDGYEAELYELRADYGRALAALESTLGRTLPLSRDRSADEAMETS